MIAPSPSASASALAARERPPRTGISGSMPWTVSTNHASSGPGTEGATDGADDHGDREDLGILGEGTDREAERRRRRRDDEDKSAADDVGQAAGRQLEGDGDDAVDRVQAADRGEIEPARLHEQDRDRDVQADREPAERGQEGEPADKAGKRGCHRPRSSGWTGMAWMKTATVAASGESPRLSLEPSDQLEDLLLESSSRVGRQARLDVAHAGAAQPGAIPGEHPFAPLTVATVARADAAGRGPRRLPHVRPAVR